MSSSVHMLAAINVTQPYPTRNFVGMNAGCVPWLGLLATNTTWWYRTDIIEQIRLLFGDHLRNQSNPTITTLSNQTQTKFRYRNGSYLVFRRHNGRSFTRRVDWRSDSIRSVLWPNAHPKNALIWSNHEDSVWLHFFCSFRSVVVSIKSFDGSRWFCSSPCHMSERGIDSDVIKVSFPAHYFVFDVFCRSMEHRWTHSSIPVGAESLPINSDRSGACPSWEITNSHLYRLPIDLCVYSDHLHQFGKNERSWKQCSRRTMQQSTKRFESSMVTLSNVHALASRSSIRVLFQLLQVESFHPFAIAVFVGGTMAHLSTFLPKISRLTFQMKIFVNGCCILSLTCLTLFGCSRSAQS